MCWLPILNPNISRHGALRPARCGPTGQTPSAILPVSGSKPNDPAPKKHDDTAQSNAPQPNSKASEN